MDCKAFSEADVDSVNEADGEASSEAAIKAIDGVCCENVDEADFKTVNEAGGEVSSEAAIEAIDKVCCKNVDEEDCETNNEAGGEASNDVASEPIDEEYDETVYSRVDVSTFLSCDNKGVFEIDCVGYDDCVTLLIDV